MLKLFKNNFSKTNDCIILAAPLIIFISIIGWFTNYALNEANTAFKSILATTTIFIIIAGFSAAWFYMVKKILKLSSKFFLFDKNRAKEMFNIICKSTRGIGDLFMPMLGILGLSTVLYSTFFFIINYCISKYISPIDLNTLGISYSFLTTDEIFNEILSLPQPKLIALNCWYILTFSFSIIFTFFTLMWIPEVVYKNKNPFLALISSIKKIFFTFKDYILLFSFVIVLYTSVCIINSILMLNPILYIAVLLISYYFVLYLVVLLFSYYEYEFIETQN